MDWQQAPRCLSFASHTNLALRYYNDKVFLEQQAEYDTYTTSSCIIIICILVQHCDTGILFLKWKYKLSLRFFRKYLTIKSQMCWSHKGFLAFMGKCQGLSRGQPQCEQSGKLKFSTQDWMWITVFTLFHDSSPMSFSLVLKGSEPTIIDMFPCLPRYHLYFQIFRQFTHILWILFSCNGYIHWNKKTAAFYYISKV